MDRREALLPELLALAAELGIETDESSLRRRLGIPVVKSEPTTLYRFFDSDGCLLYVGISLTLPARMKAHAQARPWWTDVASARFEHYPSRRRAEEAERRAIEAEAPLYNRAYNEAHGVPAEVESAWTQYQIQIGELNPPCLQLPNEEMRELRAAQLRRMAKGTARSARRTEPP